MELWTRQASGITWSQWPDVPSGLASLLDGFQGEVLVLSEAPDLECDQVASVVGLIRQLAGGRAEIVAATPHPAKDWIDALDALGVARFWVVDRRRNADGDALPFGTAKTIGQQVCPALHAITRDGVTLSVCGYRHDRLVRAWSHLSTRCLGDYRRCPDWLREHDG